MINTLLFEVFIVSFNLFLYSFEFSLVIRSQKL